VTRVPVLNTAVPHRDVGYNVLITGEWLDPAETEKNVAWARDTYAALEPYSSARRWLNYFSDDDGIDAVKAAYGPNYDRLVEVKRKYDPENLFRGNHNIPPG
jgi:FAD/FMN-containing dehydrogenase